jgi:NCAIR mutase (PurE)-related protein
MSARAIILLASAKVFPLKLLPLRDMKHESSGPVAPTDVLPEASGEGTGNQSSSFQIRLVNLLERVASAKISVIDACNDLRYLPFTDLGFARVDHHRELRNGTCEIVYGPGKADGELTAIISQLLTKNVGPIIVTRLAQLQLEIVRRMANEAGLPVWEEPRSGAIALVRNIPTPQGKTLILTAGTSDLPVAREALLAASVLGTNVTLVSDVGVAGLHRLESARQHLLNSDVVVVVAGMEAALASVIGGLVSAPVIACPTSVGYGAGFGGLAALLSMLNSCAPGVACVNIDDGLGAGYIAAQIARRATLSPSK